MKERKFKGLTLTDWRFMKKCLKNYPHSNKEKLSRYYMLKAFIALNGGATGTYALRNLAKRTVRNMNTLDIIWKKTT